MNHKKYPQLFLGIPLNLIYNCVGFSNFHIAGNLCVNRSHAPARTIIVYNQIVTSDNAIILLHKPCNFLVDFRINSFPDQRSQRILCNVNPGNHNQNRYSNAHKSINVHMPDAIHHNGKNCCRCCPGISQRIRSRCQHDRGLNPFSQFAVEQAHPQLHHYCQTQNSY